MREVKTIIRAATFPVASVEDADWKDFLESCSTAWSQARSLANWAMLELVKRDVTRTSKLTKLPPLPPDKKGGLYPYGLLPTYPDKALWAGCMSSAQSLLRWVRKQYAVRRYETIWTGSARHMSFRYPVPFPIHNRDWHPSFSADGRGSPLVQMNLPGRSFTLRLRCGSEFRRQLAQFRQLESGEAKRCEASLYSQGSSSNTHRKKGRSRLPGGGRQTPFTILLKLAGHFPVQERTADRVMVLRTDLNAFWVAEVDDRPAWIYNADHVRRWQAEHAIVRQRFSEDLKYEKRWPKEQRLHMKEALEVRCKKNNNRLDSFCHQATAMAANFAARQRVSVVAYDDEQTDYLPSFPWHMVRKRLEDKLKAFGIVLKAKPLESVSG